MPSMYKSYTAILAERVRKEVETKNIIPDNQTGFRKGMEIIDQIYALNYLINRQLGKEKGKITVLFINLKTAFDSVDKERLIKTLRARGVSEELVDRVKEVLRETKSRAKVGRRSGEIFGKRGKTKLSVKSDTLQSINYKYERPYEERGIGRGETEE